MDTRIIQAATQAITQVNLVDIAVIILEKGYQLYKEHEREKLQDKINKINAVKKIIYKDIPDEYRKDKGEVKSMVLSDALTVKDPEKKSTESKEIVEPFKIYRVTKADYFIDNRAWGSGDISTKLKDAAKHCVYYLKERSNRCWGRRGELDDYRSLTALHAIETYSLLAQRSGNNNDSYIDLLKALSKGWQTLVFYPLVDSTNKVCLKSALINALGCLNSAIKIAETELQEKASTEHLKNMINESNSIHDMNVVEIILELLSEISFIAPIDCKNLADEGWPKESKNTLLQAMLYLYSVDYETFRNNQKNIENTELQPIKKFMEQLTVFNKTTDDNKFYYDILDQLKKVKIDKNEATYRYAEENKKTKIRTGFAKELQDSNIINVVCDVLKNAALLRHNSKTLKLAYNFGKNWGDYGVYIILRKILQQLLPLTKEILAKLQMSLNELNELVQKIHNNTYKNSKTPKERGINLIKAGQAIDKYSSDCKTIHNSIRNLIKGANDWVIKAKTINQKDEKQKMQTQFNELAMHCKMNNIIIPTSDLNSIIDFDEDNEEKTTSQLQIQDPTVMINTQQNNPYQQHVIDFKNQLATMPGTSSKRIIDSLHDMQEHLQQHDNQLSNQQHARETLNTKFNIENKNDHNLSSIYDERSQLIKTRFTLFQLAFDSATHQTAIKNKVTQNDITLFSNRLAKSYDANSLVKYDLTPKKRTYKDTTKDTFDKLQGLKIS